MNAEIADKLDDIRALCERHGIARLELFGSATRDDFDPESSDFDFLVEFSVTEVGSDYGYRFLGFADDLEDLVGRPIDVMTSFAVANRYFLQELAETKQELYRATNAVAA